MAVNTANVGSSQIEIQRIEKEQEALFLENVQNQGYQHLGEPLQIEFNKDINEIRNYVQNHAIQLGATHVFEVENPPAIAGQTSVLVYYIWQAPITVEPQPFACPYCTRPFMAIPGPQAQVVACPTCGGANIIPAAEAPAPAPPLTPAPPAPPPAAVEEIAPPPPATIEELAPPPTPVSPAPPPAATEEIAQPPPAAVSEKPVAEATTESTPTTPPQAAPAAPTATTTTTATIEPGTTPPPPTPPPSAPTAPATSPATQEPSVTPPTPSTPPPAAPIAPAPTAPSATMEPSTTPPTPTTAATTAPSAPTPTATAAPATATPGATTPTAQETPAPAQATPAAPPAQTAQPNIKNQTNLESNENNPSANTQNQDYSSYYSSDMPSFDYFTKKVETPQERPQEPLIPHEYETTYNAQFTSTEQAIKTNMQKLADLLANPKNEIKFYDSGELMYPKVTIRKSAYNHLETREMDLIMIKDGVNDYKIISNESHYATGGTITPMQDELFAIKTLGHASFRAMEDWAYLDDYQKMAVSKCIYAFTEIYLKKLPKPEEEITIEPTKPKSRWGRK